MKTKSARKTVIEVSPYEEISVWQTLNLRERERYLDRGKLAPRDLDIVKKKGIDAKPRQ